MLTRWSSEKIGIIVIVLLVAGVLGEVLFYYATSSNPQTTGPKIPSSPYFDYMVTIVMENKGINWTYGSSCLGNCTYITQLANTFGLGENYSAVAHRSGPNYLTLTSGANYSYYPFNQDCAAQVGSCSIKGENIIDRIEATGRTWKAYMEDDGGGGCSRTANKDGINAYDGDHNPFLYYIDIYYNSTRCSRIVNADPGHEGYLSLPTVLLDDLNNVNATPNFMWLTPNDCNNGHSVCTVGSTNSTCTNVRRCTSQGDEYLSLLVPEILNSAVFNTRNALLFITWDEGNNCVYVGQTYPMCIDRVPAILAGPHVRRGYVSNTGLSHYSLVKTLEVAWSLPSFTTLDANANPMTEFLAPQARLDFESITDFSHYFFIRTLEVTSTFPWRPAVPFLRSSMTTLLDLRLQRD